MLPEKNVSCDDAPFKMSWYGSCGYRGDDPERPRIYRTTAVERLHQEIVAVVSMHCPATRRSSEVAIDTVIVEIVERQHQCDSSRLIHRWRSCE